MAYNIIVTKEAESDLEEGIEWYESQAKDLGIEFLLEFYSYADYLSDNADIFPVEFKHYHKMVMKRFPFIIYYSIIKNRNEVLIIAVWNTKKNPRRLNQRLK